MASIDEFVATFGGSGMNLAQANRFSIDGDATPNSPPAGASKHNVPLNMLVRDVTMAGRSIGTFVWRNIGTPVKLPYDIIQNEVTLTFADTQFHDIRQFYIKWMNEVYTDTPNAVGYGYYDKFVRQLQVYQHDKSIKNPTYGLSYINCYPIVISDMVLSNESTNTLATFSVTLSYEKVTEKLPNRLTSNDAGGDVEEPSSLFDRVGSKISNIF